MKTLPLLLLLLSSAVLWAQQPRQPVMQKERQVLYDFRQDHVSK
jgi:hypothetical protein